MKYKVLAKQSWQELEAEVSEYLAAGWTLQGGVATNAWVDYNARDEYWQSNFEYLQAVCRADSTTGEP